MSDAEITKRRSDFSNDKNFQYDDTNNLVGDGFYLDRISPSWDGDDFNEKIYYLERSVASLQKENYMYHEQFDKMLIRMESLEKDLNTFQQYNRKESIEISGFPEDVPQKDLEQYIIQILRRIGVWGLESYEIAACHRLKRKHVNDYTQRVIIRFINRKRAFQSIFNRKHLRDTIWEHPNIYIHDSLCAKYKDIYDECLVLKTEGQITKFWTYNGIIHIKNTNSYNERAKKIFHINDLQKYLYQNQTNS